MQSQFTNQTAIQFRNYAQSLKVKILAGHWTTNLLRQNGRLFQLCKNENHTLEAFIAARRLSAKFDCPVARQNCSLLAVAYDCETSFILVGHI